MTTDEAGGDGRARCCEGGFATVKHEREDDGRIIAELHACAYGATEDEATRNALHIAADHAEEWQVGTSGPNSPQEIYRAANEVGDGRAARLLVKALEYLNVIEKCTNPKPCPYCATSHMRVRAYLKELALTLGGQPEGQ